MVAYIESVGRGQSRRLIGALYATLVASLLAGCSVSFSPMSLFNGEDDPPTGSIAVKPVSPLSPDLTAEDWRRAAAALAVALDPQGNGASVGWDNPETRMRGSISPVGAPFVRNDEVCRAFLASTITQAGQEWVQGNACKPSGADWAVRDVKPWKKPA